MNPDLSSTSYSPFTYTVLNLGNRRIEARVLFDAAILARRRIMYCEIGSFLGSCSDDGMRRISRMTPGLCACPVSHLACSL